jgi:hypothetical protein
VRSCIKELMDCDAIILLPNADSKFCKDIVTAAMSANITIIDSDYFRKIIETTPQIGPIPPVS